MEPQVARREEETVDQSVFEGLFTRALRPEGAFAEELRAIGYDPGKPMAKYPGKVWVDAVDVACRHLFPELPQPEARRQLGRKFANGFESTIVGKLISTMSGFLSAEALVKRFPRFGKMGMTGLEITITESGTNWWLLKFDQRHSVPEFVIGIFESGFTGRLWQSVELVSKTSAGYAIKFTAKPR